MNYTFFFLNPNLVEYNSTECLNRTENRTEAGSNSDGRFVETETHLIECLLLIITMVKSS